jgi:hypothetical protein
MGWGGGAIRAPGMIGSLRGSSRGLTDAGGGAEKGPSFSIA